MNQGVEILLARMESNPDEFMDMFIVGDSILSVGAGAKWEWIILAVLEYVVDENKKPLTFLTEEEVHAIYGKYVSIQGNNFTKHVMKKLLDNPPEQVDWVRLLREEKPE